MLKLSYAEFYITNVCNLNCTNCNRFNNFAFTGHQKWQDYKHVYSQWADVIEIDKIGIIGGEPLANPDIANWIDGVAELWPASQIVIITNGTRLKHCSSLYNQLLKYQGRVVLDISVHNTDFEADILDWFPGPVDVEYQVSDLVYKAWTTTWDEISDPSWPKCSSPFDFENLPDRIKEECRNTHGVSLELWKKNKFTRVIKDANGVVSWITPFVTFMNSTVIHDLNTNRLSLNHCDPEKSIAVCYSKHCHHFIKGKLYKCGPVGILPEFIEQFSVDISDQDRELIHQYQPAEVEWNINELTKFVDDLVNARSIPQCTFCPSELYPSKINAGTKKIKIHKVKQLAK